MLSYVYHPNWILYAAETTVSVVKIVDCRIQIGGFEVRPQHIGEVVLRVGGLPQQEVGRADLARRTDDEVGIGHMRGVQVGGDGILGDILRCQLAVLHPLRDGTDGVFDLVTAAVIDAQRSCCRVRSQPIKDATNTSTRQQCYGNSPTKKQGYWGPTNEYVELVGDDPRADAIFSKVDSLMDSRSSAVAYNLKSVKKLLNDANDMPVIFSRVSELYLIKAEALYRSGASISEAYAPIRKLRERAGAEIILPANNEELETAIFNEWMLELSFENWHEWFAMIRFAGYTEKPDFTRLLALNKTLREALEKEYEKSEAQGDNYYQRIIDRRIDAIPSSEISSNLECKQNPGY